MKMQAPESPKFRRLMRQLGTSKPTTAGVLELMWLFCASQSPAGDLGRWSDEDIAEAIGWDGDAGWLIAALVDAGWLDVCEMHRLVVHDWVDHAPRFIQERARRGSIEIAMPTGTCESVPRRATAWHDVPPRANSLVKSSLVKPSLDKPRAAPSDDGPVVVTSEPPELPDEDDLDRAWGTPSPPSPAGSAKGANGSKKPQKTLCPEPLPEIDVVRLEDWAADQSVSPRAVQHAIETVRDWSHANGQKRTDWVATIRNAIRRGWALDGYSAPRER